ncbi:hypothetical protein TNCV_910131 [Trichonephila clavipes]|uniref:Uncharacterized protein n=1 Tax=Trichonephila clavipes TaxID=2585209 RepID=A0A8X6W3E0_TRICX|nr:hypothetical protein TNCV_910131 [Trichonephila clavipes]
MHSQVFNHGRIAGVMGIANLGTSLGLYYIFDAICPDNWRTLMDLLKYGLCGILFTCGITSLIDALSCFCSTFENAERSPASSNSPAEAQVDDSDESVLDALDFFVDFFDNILFFYPIIIEAFL